MNYKILFVSVFSLQRMHMRYEGEVYTMFGQTFFSQAGITNDI